MSFQTIDHRSAIVSTTAIQISSSSFAGGFATTNLAIAEHAIIGALTNPINISFTTTVPTSAIGIGVAANSHLEVHGSVAIEALRFVSQASTASVNVVLQR